MPVVVFACIENSFRSQLAEALFNAEAPKGWRAVSGGSNPGKAVNPVIHELLSEVGVEAAAAEPKPLTADQFREARFFITMGCGEEACPPGVKGVKHVQWDFPGATGKDPGELREIRDAIWMNVRELLEQCLAEDERQTARKS